MMRLTFLAIVMGLSVGPQALLYAQAKPEVETPAVDSVEKDVPKTHYFHDLIGTWVCHSDEQVNKLGKLQGEKQYSDRLEVDYDLEKSWVSIRYANNDIYQNQCFYDYVADDNAYRQICLSSKHAWSTAMGKVMDDRELTFKGKVYHDGRRLKTYKTFLKTDRGIEVYSKIKDPKKLLSKTWSALCKQETPALTVVKKP